MTTYDYDTDGPIRTWTATQLGEVGAGGLLEVEVTTAVDVDTQRLRTDEYQLTCTHAHLDALNAGDIDTVIGDLEPRRSTWRTGY